MNRLGLGIENAADLNSLAGKYFRPGLIVQSVDIFTYGKDKLSPPSFWCSAARIPPKSLPWTWTSTSPDANE
jgi:hypothetical protein